MMKITIKHRIIAIIVGLFFSIILLEIGIRLTGFVFLALQDYKNIKALRQNVTYRILCLGDSMTAGQYPEPLQQILNQRRPDTKFAVIDKGLPGANSNYVVLTLTEELNRYTPNMVIVTMGINDKVDLLLYGNIPKPFLKICKLAGILCDHISNKIKERHPREINLTNEWVYFASGKYAEAEKMFEKAVATNPENYWAYFGLGWCYYSQGRYHKAEELFEKAVKIDIRNHWGYRHLERYNFDQANCDKTEKMFEKAVATNPENYWAYFGLGWCYYSQGRYHKAEELFEKAVKIDAKNHWAYLQLGRCNFEQGKYNKAEKMFGKVIEINPENHWAYLNLGWCCHFQKQRHKAKEMFEEAIKLEPKNDVIYAQSGVWHYFFEGNCDNKGEKMLKKALEINPANHLASFVLGCCYNACRKYNEAEKMFKKANDLYPENDRAYIELWQLYNKQGNYNKAEEILKKGIEKTPESAERYGALALLSNRRGKAKSAEKYFLKANKIRLKYYNCITRDNYQKIKKIIAQRGIKLICMQYPMRGVEPLKKMLEPYQDIIFVDNEMIFKEAVKKEGCSEYFIDLFGSDFGHCTSKGNRLLAENIAAVIEKECFNESLQR